MNLIMNKVQSFLKSLESSCLMELSENRRSKKPSMTFGVTFRQDAERKILETTPIPGNLMDGKGLLVSSTEHPSTTNNFV